MTVPSNMNNDQARVIDPILSNHARGYSNNAAVYNRLFPVVPVPARGVKRIVFGKESFRRYNTVRAPTAKRGEVSFGYAGEAVSLRQHSLSATVAKEHQQEAQAVPGIDLAGGSITMVQDIITLDIECIAAEKARNAANYAASNKATLAGTDRWDDLENSAPDDDVADAIEAVRQNIGRRPNLMVIGPKVFKALRRHPSLKAELSTGVIKRQLTQAEVAQALDIETLVVGEMVYSTGDGVPMTDVWGTDAILAYVAGARDYRMPGYGYTYQLNGYPFVEQGYFDRDSDVWKYPVTDELVPEIVGADAGFLFKTAVSG